ncbi:MAG TPA: nicotinate-nucleotide adenylyltransferase [Anaerolineales bacterium]|jgi:nicotinate-nucleotide adenylyltransferase
MSRTRIGLFGGTFDPPHLGHLILASEAQTQLKLARLLWVLTPTPPHKLDQSIAPLEHRHAMVELAIADNPAFELSRLELDRPGPYYTLDTVRQILDQAPSADVVLVLGGDSLRDLPGWHRPADLLAACREIGVMQRPGESADLTELERALPGLSDKVRFVDAPLLEISSSEIRRRAARGEPFRYYVPAPVHEYILQHELYKNPR